MKQFALFKGAPRPKRIIGDGHTEHQHQAALITWARDSARLQTNQDLRDALNWLHSIPNGSFVHRTGEEFQSRRAPRQALKLVAEGLTKGVWDLRLDFVLREERGLILCPGMIIEMKMPGNYLSKEQKAYRDFMVRQGFREFVARSWQEGARTIIDYMGLSAYAPIYP